MSVLIKGMDMPQYCDDCPLKAGGYCMMQKDENGLIWFDNLRDKMRNCPLVEIPVPHGRLGDLDALEEMYDYEGWIETAISINAAPTVLEAERKDDG